MYMKRIARLFFSSLLGLCIGGLPLGLQAQVETAEHYLASSWQKSPLPTFMVPYQAEPEPSNSLGSLQLPVLTPAGWLLIAQATGARGRLTTQVRTAERGAGGYLNPLQVEPKAWAPEKIGFAPCSWDAATSSLAYTAQCTKAVTGIRFLSKRGEYTDFPHNGKSYSCTAPHLSADGNTLYYASNQPGGLGGYDIWRSTRDGMGWTVPAHLPAPLNGPGDELNPTLAADGSLFFAKRATASADFDLYQWQQDSLRLLPYPINTAFDDLSVTSASYNQQLYVCSNRPLLDAKVAGPPRLFRLTPKNPHLVTVHHMRTGKPLSRIPVDILASRDRSGRALSEPDGRLFFWPTATETYSLHVETAPYDTLRLKNIGLAPARTDMPLVDKEYWDVKLKFTENGKAPALPVLLAIDENGQRIDSFELDNSALYYRLVKPGSAYLLHAYCGDYPPQHLTFNTKPRNPTDSVGIALYYLQYRRLPLPVKDPHDLNIHFSWPLGAYTRIKAKDEQAQPIPDVDIQVYRDKQYDSGVKVPPTDQQGEAWVRFEKNSRYILIATAGDRIGYTELDTQSERPGYDTLSATVILNNLGTGTPFLTIPRTEDPILLQAGRPDELRILLALLQSRPDLRVELSGHADPGEGPQAQKKSKDAAEFAADFLFLHGIARDRVQVRAYGATRPRYTGGTAVERAGNKRVEVRRM
jgi:hypothetical protein